MKYLKIVGMLVLLSGFMSCNKSSEKNKQSGTESGWKLLKENGYSIEYPGDWDLNKPSQLGPSFFLFSQLSSPEDKFKENVNLIIQDLKNQNINLDKYVEISEGQIKSLLTNGTIIESKKIEIIGIEYQKVIYTGSQGLYNLKFEQYYFVDNEKAYVLTLACEASEFDNYKKTGEKIMNSFKLE